MYRNLILVATAMCAWGFGEGTFLYFNPIYLEQLGADSIAIGAILGGFGLAMTVSHIPAGLLADRFGRKPLLLAAWVLGLAATWMMALASSLPVFVAGLMIYGVTLFVISPLFSYVTAARGKLSTGRAITLISASYNLGALFGPFLGGLIGDRFGLRQTYYLAGWVFAFSTAVILFIKPQPVERVEPGETGNGRLFQRGYFLYLGAVFIATFATYLPQPLTPNFLQNVQGLSLSQIGTLFSVTSLGIVLLNLVIGFLPARFGFVLGQAAVGVFAVLLWQRTGMAWYLLAFFLLGGYKTARALATAQVRELVHSARMGLGYGLAETLNAASMMLAPLLAGWMYTRSPVSIYPLSAALILGSLFVSYRLSPRPSGENLNISPSAGTRSKILPANPGGPE